MSIRPVNIMIAAFAAMLDAVTVEPAGTSSAGVRIDIPSGLFFWHGPNMRNAAVCQPLETLTFAGTPSETLMTLSLDMGAFLRSGAGGMEWDSAFEAVFETVIPDGLPQRMSQDSSGSRLPHLPQKVKPLPRRAPQ